MAHLEAGGSGLRHQVVSFVDGEFVDDEEDEEEETFEEYEEVGFENESHVLAEQPPVLTKVSQGTTKPLILRVVKETLPGTGKNVRQEVILKPVTKVNEAIDDEEDNGLTEEEARKEASKISHDLVNSLVVYYVRPKNQSETSPEGNEVIIGGEGLDAEGLTAVGSWQVADEDGSDERKAKFICHLCKLDFTSGVEHRYHMRTFHNATAARPCPICLKPFYNTTDLKNHVMAHKGVKPFKCHKCGHAFTVKSNLTNHMLRHGPLDYECQICGKRLAQPGSLKKHMRSHSDNRPFKCTFCDKNFLQKGDLTRHQLVHNGQRDFACDLCDKQFSLKANLQTHRRKVHGHDRNESVSTMAS